MIPLLSIVIPVYNAEKTLARTLDSLLRMPVESRRSVEVILVNDGATDRSPEIAESKRQGLLPLDLAMVTQANQGLAAARNTGIRHCRGEHVFLLDADDELAFDPVPWIGKYRNDSALVFSVRYSRDGSLRSTRRPPRLTPRNALDVLTAGNAITVSSIIFRKDRMTDPFDAAMLSLEDWLFWMMNPVIFERVRSFPGTTSAIIHLHEGNMTLNFRKMGTYRRKAAEIMLAHAGDRLTRKQRNNLLIQSGIGMLQEGAKIPAKTFFLIPCALSLYMRLIVYGITRGKLGRLGLYRT
jgi:hypothetical protein